MINYFTELIYNSVFIAAAASWFVAQVVKGIIGSVKAGRFRIGYFLEGGGFPSGHSATVTGLTLMSGLSYGFDSPVFAVSFFFACVVIFDAQGVRAETGRQSRFLNRLYQEHPELLPDVSDEERERLNEGTYFEEHIGHTIKEIVAGVIVGVIVAVLLSLVLN